MSPLTHDLLNMNASTGRSYRIISAFPGTGKSHLFRTYNTERIFGVRFSGHGSEYLPEVPEFNKTWPEARAEAIDWELKSDTISGRSLVVMKCDDHKLRFMDHGSFGMVYDSDSSSYSKSPEFPQNYIVHIFDVAFSSIPGQTNTVLVSSHESVREAMYEACLEATLVFPDISLKEEYLERYKKRGSPQPFIDLLNSKWEEWITGLESDKRFHKKVVLLSGQYLSIP